jgi:hypothetical protein
MVRVKDLLCITIIASFLIAGYGCGDSGRQDASPAGKTPQPQVEKAGGFVVPSDGTPGERVKKLWESTAPVIRADARAKLGDKEYQEKRTSLFSAWVMLQGKLSLAEPKDENAQRTIPEILKLIDNLYGFPGFDPARRERDREIAKRYFDERFQKLDQQVKVLK